jgi:hypothetical protein
LRISASLVTPSSGDGDADEAPIITRLPSIA